MDLIIYLLTGLVIGIAVMMVVVKSKMSEIAKLSPENKLTKLKYENISKLKDYFVSRDKITRFETQELLDVSDSTAVRYLDTLEKQGLITQVGIDGPMVYYQKK